MYQPPDNFAQLVSIVIDILSYVIPLIFGLTFLVIVWKVVDAWILNAGDTKKIDDGKQYALAGVLVLVVMSAVWGILRLLRYSIFG